MNCNTYATERRGLLDILKETYAAGYDILSDDAKCFKLLNIETNPQLVDKCAAQINFMYKKERKLVIESWIFFCKNLRLKQTVLNLIVISCSFFLFISFFVSPFVGQLCLRYSCSL